MTMGFGELIKKYRKENKLTQEKFGKLIGKKQETISNYEKGVHFPIDAEEIKMIAKAIGESVVTVVDAIQYSRTGAIEENQALLVDIDKDESLENLLKRYKFVTTEGEEFSKEDIKEALEFMKIKRHMKRNDTKN